MKPATMRDRLLSTAKHNTRTPNPEDRVEDVTSIFTGDYGPSKPNDPRITRPMGVSMGMGKTLHGDKTSPLKAQAAHPPFHLNGNYNRFEPVMSPPPPPEAPKELINCKYGCPKGFLVPTGVGQNDPELKDHLANTCPYRPTRCEWCKDTFRFEEMPKHKKACPCRPVPCPWGCSMKLQHKVLPNAVDHTPNCPYGAHTCKWECGVKIFQPYKKGTVDVHESLECPMRKEKCPWGCSAMVLTTTMPKCHDHTIVCPYGSKFCIHGCGERFLQPFDDNPAIDEHQNNTCPMRPVPCPWKCGQKVRANELPNVPDHTPVCLSPHQSPHRTVPIPVTLTVPMPARCAPMALSFADTIVASRACSQ